MSALKERIFYVKNVEGMVTDFETEGHWVDAQETEEGGAELSMAYFDVQCIDKMNQNLLRQGKECELLIKENGYSFVVVEKDGKQVPFEEIMKAIVD